MGVFCLFGIMSGKPRNEEEEGRRMSFLLLAG